MLKNVIIPNKIGQYYLFSKTVLSIEVTSGFVSGLLLHYQNRQIVIKNRQIVYVRENSNQGIVNAIKKIATTIGFFDEVITSLSSSVIIFKEIQLPFVEREKIEMVVSYEVESQLPFSLEESVVEFLITSENKEKNISTILVAAVRREDVEQYIALFQKAHLEIKALRIDMFELYTLYHYGYYEPYLLEIKKESKTPVSQDSFVTLMVDISYDVTRVLYIHNGILQAVRIIPRGISEALENIAKSVELSSYDVGQMLLVKHDEFMYQQELKQELSVLFDMIFKTLSFFEQQKRDIYKKPHKIIFSGIGSSIVHFIQNAQDYFDITVQLLPVGKMLKSLHIKTDVKAMLDCTDSLNLAVGLSDKYDEEINLLDKIDQSADNKLFYKQCSMIVLLTIVCIGGIFWNSYAILQEWNIAYNQSKKELLSKIDQTMHIDLKKQRNVKEIVRIVEDTLKAEKRLWFSFSKQKEMSYLQYLQELTNKIDRNSIGLEISKMYMDYEKVIITGTVKNFESLAVFEEELTELTSFDIVENPRELSFSVQLNAKDKDLYDGV